jgi:hypothetical protein
MVSVELPRREFFGRVLLATRAARDGGPPFWIGFYLLPDGRVESGILDGNTLYKSTSPEPVPGFDGHRAGVIDREAARKILGDFYYALRVAKARHRGPEPFRLA